MPASKPTEKKQAESFSNFSTFTRGGSDDAFGRLCRKVPPDSMSSAPYSSFSSSSISLADTYDDDAIESFRACFGADTNGFVF